MRRLITLLTVAGMALSGLITVAGLAAHATTPGENGRIAFSMDRGSGAEIYTIRVDGSGLRRLTHLDGNAVAASWSPDGTRIAFWLEDEALYVMNADGSDQHIVKAGGGREGTPAFTPDGNHLVYEGGNRDRPSGIFLMRADGSDAPGRRLTTTPFPHWGDVNPEVSPDGQTVTFARLKGEGLSALFAVDIDGSDVRKLVPYRASVGTKHDWAPDGNHILITRCVECPDENPNVATIRPDGSDLTMVTKVRRPGVMAFAGSYSPNGRSIVYHRDNLDLEVFRMFEVRPDGRDRTLIAKTPFAPRGNDWGPRPRS